MRLNTIVLTTAISMASTIPAIAHHGWGGNVDEVTAVWRYELDTFQSKQFGGAEVIE